MSEAREEPGEKRRARSSGDPVEGIHDDDELAAALREQLERFAPPTGSIPVIPSVIASAEHAPSPGRSDPGAPDDSAPVGSAPRTAGSDTQPAAEPAPPAPGRVSWPSFARADRIGDATLAAGPGESSDRRRSNGRWAEPAAAAGFRIDELSSATEPAPALDAELRRDGPAAGRSARDVPGSSPERHGPSAAVSSSDPESPPSLPEGNALQRLEQLQPALSNIRLDPETFADWERSLLALSPEAAPPLPPSAVGEAPPGPRRRSATTASVRETALPATVPPAPAAEGVSPNSAAGIASSESAVVPLPAVSAVRPVPPVSAVPPVPAAEAVSPEWAVEVVPPATEAVDAGATVETAPPELTVQSFPPASAATAVPSAFTVDAASPGFAAAVPLDLPLLPPLPVGLPVEPSLLPPLPDPTSPVLLQQALPSLPVTDTAGEVIDAELVDEDETEQEAPPEAPVSGIPVDVQLAVSATEAAALAARSPADAPVDEVPTDDGEAHEHLDVDGITTETGPVRTGSVPVVAALDRDLDDDVDDLAAPGELLPVSGSIPLQPGLETGPVIPVSSAAVRTGAISLPVADAGPPSSFAVEEADLRPIEEEQRLRRPVAQFWLWLAPNSSALTLVLGASLVALGISFRQAVVAAVLGVTVACLPLVVNVLAVKRSAQPVAVASRASFGARGNLVPTALLLLVRLFWAAALTWLAAGAVRSVLASAGWDDVMSPTSVAVVFAVVFPVVACLIAVFGHGLLARVHLVLGALSAVLLLLLLGLTAPLIDGATLLAVPDGSPLAMVGAAVAVMSLLAVAWAAAGGELARYQQSSGSGVATAAWASLGAAAPALLLTVWGVLLAASGLPNSGDAEDPVATVLALLPAWAPAPLLLATVLGLVAALATVLYSTGLTAGALGIPGSRAVRTAPAGIVAVAAGITLVLTDPPFAVLLGDVLPVLAVPVLAWTGIMGAELLLRPRAFDASALVRRGEAGDIRWPTLLALVAITVVGIGLVGSSDFAPAAGYLWTVFGLRADSALAQSDLGVPLAILLGAATALVLSRVQARRSETASP